VITRLSDLRLIDLAQNSLYTMMTPGGAADLRSRISPLGNRLIAFIKA
jgi:hypothetical protein